MDRGTCIQTPDEFEITGKHGATFDCLVIDKGIGIVGTVVGVGPVTVFYGRTGLVGSDECLYCPAPVGTTNSV